MRLKKTLTKIVTITFISNCTRSHKLQRIAFAKMHRHNNFELSVCYLRLKFMANYKLVANIAKLVLRTKDVIRESGFF